MPKRDICLMCGREPDEDELAPLEVRLTVTNTAGYGALFDPSGVPAWVHAIAQLPEQHVKVCASCSAAHIAVTPDLVANLIDAEVRKERMSGALAEKFKARAAKDEEKAIKARAKKLGASTPQKEVQP